MATTDLTKLTPKKIEGLPFETAFEHLEAISDMIDIETLGLDDSVALFEIGVLLSKRCRELLDDAQRRISVLSEDGEVDFDNDDVD